MAFENVPHGHLQEGDETEFGIIEAVTFTAYLIDGRWIPFCKVHGDYKVVTPLDYFWSAFNEIDFGSIK